MEALAYHLRQLIKINRRIINQLHKDEASINEIRQAFNEREVHTQKMGTIVPGIDKEKLSAEQSDFLSTLFNRFDKQNSTIQHAFDYILKESQKKLNRAVKQRKAEQSYTVLNK